MSVGSKRVGSVDLAAVTVTVSCRAATAPSRDDSDANANANGNGRPDAAQRDAIKTQLQQFTVPPEAILIRRMHGIVSTVLQQLRAGADWGAIAGEYLHGAAPATALGEAEADFFAAPRQVVADAGYSDNNAARRPRARCSRLVTVPSRTPSARAASA